MNSKELLDLLPDYYNKSELVENILNAYALQFTKLKQKYDNATKQMSWRTADTDIYRYEQEYGLSNNTYSIEYRRAAVGSKIKGQETITKKVLEDILLDYCDKVEITVHNKEFYLEMHLTVNALFVDLVEKIVDLVLILIPADFGLKISIMVDRTAKGNINVASAFSNTSYYKLSSYLLENYKFKANLINANKAINTNSYTLR